MVAYRFQPGALDIIAQEKRLTSEQALATALGITTDQLANSATEPPSAHRWRCTSPP